MDAVNKEWMGSNRDRPFDPPLTERGAAMGFKAGEAIQDIIKKENLPPISRIFSSPLIRCVQTVAEVKKSVGFDGPINPEPALAEIIFEEWYRSWGVPGTTGQWGGPPNCGLGVPVAKEDLHPGCLRPAGELYLTPTELTEKLGDIISQEYEPQLPSSAVTYCWGNVETPEQGRARVGRFAEHCAEKYPGETVVMCSHGGPTSMMYQALGKTTEELESGYTAIFAFTKEDGGWKTISKCSTAHLGDLNPADLGLLYAPSK